MPLIGPHPNPLSHPWLTTLQAARYANCSSATLRRAAAKRTVTCGLMNRRYRFQTSDIDEWLLGYPEEMRRLSAHVWPD